MKSKKEFKELSEEELENVNGGGLHASQKIWKSVVEEAE